MSQEQKNDNFCSSFAQMMKTYNELQGLPLMLHNQFILGSKFTSIQCASSGDAIKITLESTYERYTPFERCVTQLDQEISLHGDPNIQVRKRHPLLDFLKPTMLHAPWLNLSSTFSKATETSTDVHCTPVLR